MHRRYLTALGFAIATTGSVRTVAQSTCPNLTPLTPFITKDIGPIPLFQTTGTGPTAILFASKMEVDADGTPDAYHPDDLGTTFICNGLNVAHGGVSCDKAVSEDDCLADYNKAKATGFKSTDPRICFYAVVTKDGVPVVQGPDDPKPGYFISTTSPIPGRHYGSTVKDQLDANQIPYIVLPGQSETKFPGVQLGDLAAIYRKSNSTLAFAVLGDGGPRNQLGEGSIKLHQMLGHDPISHKGAVPRAKFGIGDSKNRDIVYVVFPASHGDLKDFSVESIQTAGQKRLDAFATRDQLKSCATQIH